MESAVSTGPMGGPLREVCISRVIMEDAFFGFFASNRTFIQHTLATNDALMNMLVTSSTMSQAVHLITHPIAQLINLMDMVFAVKSI